MKNKIKKIIRTSENKLIKVQLDYRTIITLTKLSSLDAWLIRYPNAKVMTT